MTLQYKNSSAAMSAVGAIVENLGDEIAEGLLPLDGNYFSPTDFPKLSSVLQDNKLPFNPAPNLCVVTGATGSTTLVVDATVGSEVPFSVSTIINNDLASGSTVTSIYALATDGDGVFIMVGKSGHAMRSTDHGQTWVALPTWLNSGESAGLRISSLDTDGKGTWICGTWSGYSSRSTDNGATWSPLPRYLSIGETGIKNITSGKEGVWIATGSSGANSSISTDNGLTWAIGPDLGGYVVTDKKGVWISANVKRSTDNGSTWTPLPTNFNSNGSGTEAYVITTDLNGVWVVNYTNGYAARSQDNGATWVAMPRGMNTGNIYIQVNCMATDGAGTWVYSSSGGVNGFSTDNGDSWTSLPTNFGGGSTASTFKIISNNKGKWLSGGSYKSILFVLESQQITDEYQLN